MKRYELERSEGEWRAVLSPERYRVLRESGTEPPFTGEYVDTVDEGVYRCAACGNPLFRSETKYHSGCGWPSFYRPVSDDALEELPDTSHGMTRTEIRCARAVRIWPRLRGRSGAHRSQVLHELSGARSEPG